MIDIVFPKDNEAEFIRMAERLGHEGLIFVHDRKKDISSLAKTTDLKLYSISSKRILKASKKAFETSSGCIIYGLEDQEKDFLFVRNSGLDERIAQLAEKNKIILGFSFSLLLSSKKRSNILARFQENAKYARRYRLRIALASFAKDPWQLRQESDLLGLARVLGIPTSDLFLNHLNIARFLNENN